MKSLLSVTGLSKSFGKQAVLRDLELELAPRHDDGP